MEVFMIITIFSKKLDGKWSFFFYLYISRDFSSGAFGVVHRCIEKSTGKTYAAKFIPTLSPADKATVRREMEVMMELNHPKLLHLHDAFEEEVEMAMVTEFIAGGELFDRIADPNYKMTEAEAIKYMRQICQGLRHMHENNIVHLDLKVRRKTRWRLNFSFRL
jgi:serine/threonine protein kinase